MCVYVCVCVCVCVCVRVCVSIRGYRGDGAHGNGLVSKQPFVCDGLLTDWGVSESVSPTLPRRRLKQTQKRAAGTLLSFPLYLSSFPLSSIPFFPLSLSLPLSPSS